MGLIKKVFQRSVLRKKREEEEERDEEGRRNQTRDELFLKISPFENSLSSSKRELISPADFSVFSTFSSSSIRSVQPTLLSSS